MYTRQYLLFCEFTHPLTSEQASALNITNVRSISPKYTTWTYQFTKLSGGWICIAASLNHNFRVWI